jgi:hypothetical protein
MKKLNNFYLYFYLFAISKKYFTFFNLFTQFINLKFIYLKFYNLHLQQDDEYAFWYKLQRSNQFLSVYADVDSAEEHLLALSLRNQLLQRGKKTGWFFFNEFLFFLKFNYYITGLYLLIEQFLEAITLPYKLYVVRFSNRNYYFPGPILSDAEQLAFIRKAFSAGIRKQHDIKYINKFFLEIVAFINKSSDSILLQILNHIIDQGLENRAFIHYRWQLHKRQ